MILDVSVVEFEELSGDIYLLFFNQELLCFPQGQ